MGCCNLFFSFIRNKCFQSSNHFTYILTLEQQFRGNLKPIFFLLKMHNMQCVYIHNFVLTQIYSKSKYFNAYTNGNLTIPLIWLSHLGYLLGLKFEHTLESTNKIMKRKVSKYFSFIDTIPYHLQQLSIGCRKIPNSGIFNCMPLIYCTKAKDFSGSC